MTGWPADAKLLALSEKDDRSLLLRYRLPTEDPQVFLYQLVLVDVHDGTWTKLFAPYNATSARLPVLNENYVGWWYPGAGARLLRRDALDGPAITVPYQGTQGKTDFTVVGDNVVLTTYGDETRAVLTRPLTDAANGARCSRRWTAGCTRRRTDRPSSWAAPTRRTGACTASSRGRTGRSSPMS